MQRPRENIPRHHPDRSTTRKLRFGSSKPRYFQCSRLGRYSWYESGPSSPCPTCPNTGGSSSGATIRGCRGRTRVRLFR
jgi:hypothetical protein